MAEKRDGRKVSGGPGDGMEGFWSRIVIIVFLLVIIVFLLYKPRHDANVRLQIESEKEADALFNGLVEKLFSLEQKQKAEPLYQLLKKEPKNAELHRQMGGIYAEVARKYTTEDVVNAAISHFELAQELDQGNPSVQIELGKLYLQLGKFGMALQRFNSSISSGGQETALLGAGWAAYGMGDYGAATSYFTEAAVQGGDEDLSYSGLGWSRYRMADFAGAQRSFLQVKEDRIGLIGLLAAGAAAGNEGVQEAAKLRLGTDSVSGIISSGKVQTDGYIGSINTDVLLCAKGAGDQLDGQRAAGCIAQHPFFGIVVP